MMVKLSCVILANTKDESSYRMTINCITSLIDSLQTIGHTQILLIESNPNYDRGLYKYPKEVQVVETKDSSFNFHRNLNRGLEKSEGEYIAFCNNDLMFHEDWFTQILSIAEDKSLKAFSPVDPKEPKLPHRVTSNFEYMEGYEIQKFFKGWCFVVRSSVFRTTGNFDERFNFYFADNDFIMTLKKYHLRHVAVMNSKVEHLQKETGPYIQNMDTLLNGLTIDRSKIPDYVLKEKRYWLLTSDKMVNGLIQYHKKWGSFRALKVKEILARLCVKLRMPYLKRFIYLTN